MMVLYSPDWTNTGFSFILLTVNLFRHSTLTEQGLYFRNSALTLFVCFDSLRPINNLSVKQGRVFQGCTSTKLG